MTKTNWQDPKTSEIRSTQISGLQEAVSKIEESIDLDFVYETNIFLSEVFISNDDRHRIYQAPVGKRNWMSSPTPVIKRNGLVITDDFEIDYGGGAIIFTTPLSASAVVTIDASYTKKIDGKQLSTNDYTDEEKLKNQSNKDDILNLSETVGDTTIDDTLVPTSDTGLSVKILLSWLGNMIKSITGKSSWRMKPTKNLEELNTALGAHEAESVQEDNPHGLSVEEGVWTPIVAGSIVAGENDYSAQSGTYYKVGRMVTCVFAIQISTHDTTMSGNALIKGLPFTSKSNELGASFSRFGKIEFPSETTQLTGRLHTNNIQLQASGNNLDGVPLPIGGIKDGGRLFGSITYYI